MIAGTGSVTINEGVEDFSEEELRLPVDDDEGSSAISEQDYLRADDEPKDRDVSAANKVIWKGTHEQTKTTYLKKIKTLQIHINTFKLVFHHAIDNLIIAAAVFFVSKIKLFFTIILHVCIAWQQIFSLLVYILMVSDNFPFFLMLDICVLDILFCQNTTFLKVPDHMNFYECSDLRKKYV